MAFTKTRQDIVNRARREAHRKGDTGTGNDRDLHEMTVDVLNEWHEAMASSSWSGVGKAIRTLTVATAGPTLDLPSEHMFLKAWSRDDLPTNGRITGATPVRVLPVAFITFRLDVPGNEPRRSQGVYYLEGPGQEFNSDLQVLVTYPQRLRVSPDFPVGTTVKLLYISQPPDFGDPQVEADDTTAVDMIVPSNYKAIASLVRLVYVGRGDSEEYRRALQIATEAAAVSAEQRDSQDQHRSIDPLTYSRSGGSDGYGL